jgi:RNA polymerase sigma-70 factor (ECF subfamily)
MSRCRAPGVTAVIEDRVAAPIAEPQLKELEPVVYRFALRAVGDPELARDLTQEALLAAVAQGGTFAGRSTLRTWVIGILSHKVMDHFRRRATQAADDDDAELLRAPSPEDVERVVGARQRLHAVERALAELPDLERLALLLIEVEGVSRENCCSALRVSATHLRVLLHRGRNRLRRMLEE